MGISVGVGVSKIVVKVFHVMGKVLTGKLSCPCYPVSVTGLVKVKHFNVTGL